jgi:hypothetical protein
MAAKNILMMSLMRILTPEEINELTTKHEGDSRVSLTELLEKSMKGIAFEHDQAKILPFSKKKNNIVCGSSVLEQLNAIQVEEHKVAITGFERHKIERDENGNTSNFILSEKEKFKDSHVRLKKKEVFNLYQKAASVDIELERKSSDDLKKSTKVGVLVDKAQY